MSKGVKQIKIISISNMNTFFIPPHIPYPFVVYYNQVTLIQLNIYPEPFN